MTRIISYCPGTEEEVGSVEAITADEIPVVFRRSKEAQRMWADVPSSEKAKLFDALTKRLADNVDEYAHVVHNETGKTKADAINTEIFVSATYSQYCSDWLKKFKPVVKLRMDPVHTMMRLMGRSAVLRYSPMGIIAVISPYNFPFSIPFCEIATALATGNSVVLKTSRETPLCGTLLQRIFEESGFPKGLVISVNGPGIGDAITSSKEVSKIMFTGSTEVGKDIMASAAKNLTPLALELGGCDPVVIFDDIDVERAVDGTLWGGFVNAGQVCVGYQRLIVHRNIYDRFCDMYVRKLSELKVGCDWDDPTISIGPVINEKSVKKLEESVELAKKAGGIVRIGGKRMDRKGHFFEPTVVTDMDVESEIYKEEVFGPYVTIVPFDTEDEAVRIANISEYALGGSVWSKDRERAMRVVSQIKSGILSINNGIYSFSISSSPWGGSGASGFGKSHSNEGFYSLMKEQCIHIDSQKYDRDPWWMPVTKESTDKMEGLVKGLYGSDRRKLGALMDMMPLMKRKKSERIVFTDILSTDGRYL